jgi:SpoVK/Ycf46/Vps4 family AAA+-type ATPase
MPWMRRIEMNDEKRVKRPAHQQLLDLKGWVRRVKPVTTWDDLTYPQRIVTGLKTICSAFTPGRSQLCLFAGTSGTGKTMAAEVIAGDLRFDLYRIDLSKVVSKYIGETEKNLSRIFDAAESGGAVLLFDEADALFGNREEGPDSRDRYASVLFNSLLRRMEECKDLAILAINARDFIDSSLPGRFRYVVDFSGLEE